MRENRIMILEDDIVVAIDLQELLIDAGYQVMSAHTYKEGISLAKKFRPNLAICDINLGEKMTGIDFAKDVYIVNPTLEIIYSTAFSNQQNLADAEMTKHLNYIVKPWNEEQIKVTVQLAFSYIYKKHKKESSLRGLSMTEYKIVDLIAKQKKSKEIADILFVSEKTVRNHRYNIIKKLGLPNDNNTLLKWAIMNLNEPA